MRPRGRLPPGTSAELKVMTNQGQTLTIDVLDIYSLNQGSPF